jgi:serine/threonine-protein phosphatase 2A catalytic subunit
MSKAKNFD